MNNAMRQVSTGTQAGYAARIDTAASTFVALYFVLRTTNMTISSLHIIPAGMYLFFLYALAAVLAFYLLLTLRTIVYRRGIYFLVAESMFIFAYLVSILMNPILITQILSRAFWTTCACIPLGVYVLAVEDKRMLYNMMLKASVIMAVLLVLVFFNPLRTNVYMMNFSNAMLYPCLMGINEFFDRKNPWYLALGVYSVLTILLLGSRGALICIIVFVGIKLVKNTKGLMSRATLIFVMSLLGLFYEQIIFRATEFLMSIGIVSRSIRLLMSNLTYNSGRTEIWRVAQEMVRARWFTGWGVVGELNKLGTYPHSIIWELLIDYGALLGGLLLIALVILCIRMLRIKDQYTFSLSLMFFAISVRLFVSGTYLTSEPFFIFVFLALS